MQTKVIAVPESNYEAIRELINQYYSDEIEEMTRIVTNDENTQTIPGLINTLNNYEVFIKENRKGW